MQIIQKDTLKELNKLLYIRIKLGEEMKKSFYQNNFNFIK